MKAALFAIVLAVSGGGCGPSATRAGSGGPMTPKQIAEAASPSVVRIETPNGMGTGFVVWQDGRIVTNLHIIAGAGEARVILHDKRTFTEIEVLAADRAHDLAILRIPVKNLPTLRTGDSTVLKAGDRVVAIGNPMGLETTVTDGLISAVRQIDPKLTLLQISAPISPGSSGGPLFNERGEVIGVTTLFSAEGQNLNFAVPVEYLKPMLLSDRGMSLQAFSRAMEVAMLEGCKGADIEHVYKTIVDAIGIGAPLFNSGDHEGCYRVYEKTALELVPKLEEGCTGIKERLLAGLMSASKAQKYTDKAWAMRHAFDSILRAIRTAIDAAIPKT
jgi:serine protease Do